MRVSLFLTVLVLITGCGPAAENSNNPMTKIEATIDAAVDSVLAAHPEATVAVALDDGVTGATYLLNEHRSFHAASTMKIPVMIEVYRQAGQGRFSLDDELEVVNAFHSIVDSSRYSIEDDSDDAIYTKLGQKMTLRALVYQMITVSSNLATNLLIDFVSADTVQATAEALGVKNMKVLRGVEDLKAFDLGMSNTTTAADLAVLLAAIRDGKAVSVTADQEMVDVLLAQEFNEMIPAGLPATARAAHKTGWITAIHHDAALVYPEGTDPYVLVILIEGITDHAVSAQVGATITAAIHQALR
ncbi:MAG: serine hydrolase [Bacteroidota bacterium]